MASWYSPKAHGFQTWIKKEKKNDDRKVIGSSECNSSPEDVSHHESLLDFLHPFLRLLMELYGSLLADLSPTERQNISQLSCVYLLSFQVRPDQIHHAVANLSIQEST